MRNGTKNAPRDGPLSIPGVYCVGAGAMADAVYINVGDGARRDAREEQRLHADTEHRNGQRDVADAARRADPFHAASRRSVAALTNARDGSQSIE